MRKGHATYAQAKNIAKFGTIDSITFDAATGAVVALNAMGISATITFLVEVWNGRDASEALNKAIYTGIQAGGTAFVTSVLAAQLTRTSLNSVLLNPSIAMVKLLPSPVRHYLVNALRDGANIYGGAATNNLAKLLRSNFIAAGVMTAVITAPQVLDLLRGRISARELFKTVTVTVSSIGGGTLGMAIGSLAGPIGSVIGGLVGGALAGQSVSKILNEFVESDAQKMLKIIDKEAPQIMQDYLVNEEECELIVDDLKIALGQGALLAMYASADRNYFARQLLEELTLKTISFRATVQMPSEKMLCQSMGKVVDDLLNNREMPYLATASSTKVNPVEMAKNLLGRDVEAHAAKKAWYVTKQFNASLQRSEAVLEDMYKQELAYKRVFQVQKTQLEINKREFSEMVDSLVKEN